MASMSRNTSQNLMGFSVHQPEIGAPLQFFPAMGSKELDDLIDAYVPGQASILEKRAAVSLEFFDHSIQTGELFKFFMVYPSLPSATTSPASLQDSGYASSFDTSPIMSESQWAAGSSSRARQARSAKKSPVASRAQAADFSHIPGMKIMTRDGTDVTNSASRGCKTREQRDHAHLMRIIKACDSCRRKKTRCDPSHKKRGSSATSSPEPQTSKKQRTHAAPPPQKLVADEPSFEMDLSFDATIPENFVFDDSFATVADATNEWDQFITYDEEVAETIPHDYDFFFDPAGYFSPTTTDTNSSSSSSSQILTPAQSQPITPVGILDEVGLGRTEYADAGLFGEGLGEGFGEERRQPMLPYLHPGGVDVGNNYVDFALYSPGSTCLDDDPALSSEVAASRGPGYSETQQLSSRNKAVSRAVQRREADGSPQSSSSLTRAGSGTLSTSSIENSSAVPVGSESLFSRDATPLFNSGVDDQFRDRDQSSQGRNSVRPVTATSSSLAASAHSPKPRVPGATIATPPEGGCGGGCSPLRPAHAAPGDVASPAVIYTTAVNAEALRVRGQTTATVRTSAYRLCASPLTSLSQVSERHSTMESRAPVATQSIMPARDASALQESLSTNSVSGESQSRSSRNLRHQRRVQVADSGATQDGLIARASVARSNKRGLQTYQDVADGSSMLPRTASGQSTLPAPSVANVASGQLFTSASAVAALSSRSTVSTGADVGAIALGLVPAVVLMQSRIWSGTTSKHSCQTTTEGAIDRSSERTSSRTEQHHSYSWWTTAAAATVALTAIIAIGVISVIGQQALVGAAGAVLSLLASSLRTQKHSVSGLEPRQCRGGRSRSYATDDAKGTANTSSCIIGAVVDKIDNARSRFHGLWYQISGRRRDFLNTERAAWVHLMK